MTCLTQALVSKREAAASGLRDAYKWHQAIWEAFPDRDDEKRDFLFRLDDKGRTFRLYVLSSSEPTPPGWGQWQSKPVASSFLEHQEYRFQLKANPTMRRCSDRRRVALYAEDRLREWMHRKAEASGFELVEESLVVGAPVDDVFRRNGKAGKHVGVDFQGLVRVTDRNRFKQAFEKGIGSAKAFGFGMLMLQPVH